MRNIVLHPLQGQHKIERRENPAEVWKTTGSPSKVYLTRTCDAHGENTACLASDARFYWLAQGDPSNACGPGCACSADPAVTEK